MGGKDERGYIDVQSMEQRTGDPIPTLNNVQVKDFNLHMHAKKPDMTHLNSSRGKRDFLSLRPARVM